MDRCARRLAATVDRGSLSFQLEILRGPWTMDRLRLADSPRRWTAVA